MEFKIQNIDLDMGETAFENMFLNTYVPLADGDSLKLFLLVYKDLVNEGKVDLEKIKKQLLFDDKKLESCINYWVNMGMFRKKDQGDGRIFIEIISLRQIYFGKSTSKEESSSAFDFSKRRSVMFSSVERIIQRALTPQDVRRIHETLDEYKQDPELVTEAFRQAKEVNNVDVKYVMGFLKTWRDQSIFSLNDLKIKEERDKLLKQKSIKKVSRKKTFTSKNRNSINKSYSQKAREERFRRILEGDDK